METLTSQNCIVDFDLIWKSQSQFSRFTIEYFMDNQQQVIDNLNHALESSDNSKLNEDEERIFYSVKRHFDREARKAANTKKYAAIVPHVAPQIELGTILYSSWGYEQTNVDFYCVVEMTAKSVKLLVIKKELTMDMQNSMSGSVMATEEIDYASEILTKRFKGTGANSYVKIESYANASIWSGKKEYCSWYA